MPVSKTRKPTKRKKGPDGHIVVPISALSQEHPLECCAINSNWKDAHMANVIIVRKTTGGFTAVGFLVDTWGVGLKDVFMHKGLSRMGLDKLLTHSVDEDKAIDCPLALAQELVYGGLAWARQHGFRIPGEVIRYLKILPAPLGEPDISRFGAEGGRPLLIF